MAELLVYGRYSGMNGCIVAYTLVDAADEPLARRYRWHLGGRERQYAMAVTERGTVLLHRLLLEAQPGQRVRHLNGNRLDHRRANPELVHAVNVVPPHARVAIVADEIYPRPGARS
ncbi:hypothetical protein [Deinococcus peraridilitoris]|uniref:HNH nuclease domain-containing protein n=1 Tax=Deinococcus peraridilitoris (strain DSM 19664 / LMG 22246 / CIP 109416 / KR-200) TaxID=937777 RepID=L0A8Z5_DEIPD|nr:hypothetical protein [Deinococcus peraridilitoris]AFZ69535.1 hypothetical protein Deipe_4168 [Deinococcus peraridilitoris DSM 19664]